ncbi:hypothetical protein BANRA_04267 [Escherichia coli]|nr:hypothetical protein BANRA_04267 [Escherichia coli]
MYNFITIMYDVFSCFGVLAKTRIAVTSEILKFFLTSTFTGRHV